MNSRVLRSGWRRVSAVVLALFCYSAGFATGQCTQGWRTTGVEPGVNETVFDLTIWDPDGAGPLSTQVVAAGVFTSAGGIVANRIARWDGTAWHPFGSGMDGGVGALTTWDPDGEGPLSPQLVAGGNFTTAGGTVVNCIARWDGEAWQAFGTGTSDDVSALTTWDPDGSGPLPAQLIAGGAFFTADGVTVNCVARWDGEAWQPLGTGVNSNIYALTTWDPDGAGPQHSRLVAGGAFSLAGGVEARRIALWDGTDWVPVGAGIPGSQTWPSGWGVFQLVTWDPDGDGPRAAVLAVGGRFAETSLGHPNPIYYWNGVVWETFGVGLGGLSYVLSTWDPDGGGPLSAQLVVGGRFGTVNGEPIDGMARWDGASWHAFAVNGSNGDVGALASWDLDGAGPLPAQLIAGGSFSLEGGVLIDRIARWDGSEWGPLGTGMDNTAHSLTVFDVDGSGPLPKQVIAGGAFQFAGGVVSNRIARWDGSSWQPIGAGFSNSVYVVTTLDPDGAGPLAEQLFAGGRMGTSGNVSVGYVSRWDGTAWQRCGVLNNYVTAFTTWDPDGPGPLAKQLIAGGWFTTAGAATVNRIARWDGTTWHPLGEGMNGTVRTLAALDPDGDGPLPSQLVAGGEFLRAGGVTVNRIARWDGTAWHAFGSGMTGDVYALATWDPDGAGSLPTQLVAGGAFITAGGVTVNRIARWDGATWHPFGTGIAGSGAYLLSIMSWDPDDSGLLPKELIAGGMFTTAGGETVNGVARWDGSRWRPLGTGLNAGVSTLMPWDFDGAGPIPSQLVVAGNFTATTAGLASAGVAFYGCTAAAVCTADIDDGSGAGVADGAVTIDDLLFFFTSFEAGSATADLDDGTGTGVRDDAVTIEDMLFFLVRFEIGC